MIIFLFLFYSFFCLLITLLHFEIAHKVRWLCCSVLYIMFIYHDIVFVPHERGDYSRKNKPSPLETPQNSVSPPWKFQGQKTWSLEILHDFFDQPWKFQFVFLTPGNSTCYFFDTPGNSISSTLPPPVWFFSGIAQLLMCEPGFSITILFKIVSVLECTAAKLPMDFLSLIG